MNLICVDDVERVMHYIASLCRNQPGIDEVQGFTHAMEALEWAKNHPVDVAVLDIDMPDMNGLILAARIREIRPACAIIFLTAFAEFALNSFQVHPSGYLLKPVNEEDLAREISYAVSRLPSRTDAHIQVQTFGNFEILVDGETLRFRRAKAKELLAYLVDQQGHGVTRQEIFYTLWEEDDYNLSRQKYLDVVIRTLRETLANYGIEDILEMKSGFLRIRPEKFSCDLYRLLEHDPAAVHAYRGKYMSSYAWAVLKEAELMNRLSEPG